MFADVPGLGTGIFCPVPAVFEVGKQVGLSGCGKEYGTWRRSMRRESK